jgi:hypothetical protein
VLLRPQNACQPAVDLRRNGFTIPFCKYSPAAHPTKPDAAARGGLTPDPNHFEIWARPRPKATSNANGADIWFETKGDGPALVLIHANPLITICGFIRARISTWFRPLPDIRRLWPFRQGHGAACLVWRRRAGVMMISASRAPSSLCVGSASHGLGLDIPERFEASSSSAATAAQATVT